MMDINSVMENITSMSEYYVASNTRTPYTENASDWQNSSATSNAIDQIDNQPANITDSTEHQQTTKPMDVSTVAAVAASRLSDGVPGIEADTDRVQAMGQPCHTPNNVTSFGMSPSFSAQTQQQTQRHFHTRTSIAVHTIIESSDSCQSPTSISNLNVPDPLSSSNEQQPGPTVNRSTHLLKSLNNLSSLNGTKNHSGTHPPHQLQSKLALETVTNETNLFHENQDEEDDDDNDMNFESTLNNSTQSSNNSKNDLNDFLSDDLFIETHQETHELQQHSHQQSKIESQQSFYMQDQPQTSSYSNTFRETYSIISSNVLFIDLVRTVLVQLGYTTTDLINAKSELLIRNWKPIALDQVTDNKKATVGDILGDISSVATLRIRLCSSPPDLSTEWTESMTRQVVLALTQTMSQLALAKLCNISQPLISSIVRGNKRLGRRKCAEFGRWYMNYIKNADSMQSNNSQTITGPGRGAAGCTRLVYDKNREIPQLKSWFSGNPTPSNELLEQYCRILNEDPLRKDRPDVTVKALRNWWKNERQKLGIRQRDARSKLE